MGGTTNAAANNGRAQVMQSAPDVAIVGAATLGNAEARTIMAAVCLVMVAVGVFAAPHIRFTLDLPAGQQLAIQDLPIGVLTESPEDRALMAGAHLTGEQAAREAPTVLDGAAAACGSCDARHRNLGRLGESTAP